jgi:tetratricopeptide (TPR) repeat protein
LADPDKTRIARAPADTTEPGAGETVDEPGAPRHSLRKEPPHRSPIGFLVSLVGVFVLGALVWFLQQPEKVPEVEKLKPPEETEQQKVERLLTRARNCLDSNADAPDWDGCEAAAKSALDLNPIDREANEITKRLAVERTAFDAYSKGGQALGFNRLEDGLELLEKVPRDSHYFLKAYDAAQRVLPDARKTWSERCKKYVDGAKWPQAEVDCGWLMRTTCGQLPEDAFAPLQGQPACSHLKVKNCWKPGTEDVTRFLTARDKVEPGQSRWICPKHPLYAEHKPKPKKFVPPTSFGDKDVDAAFALYLRGNVNDAITALQKFQEKTQNAALHGKARGLQRDIAAIDGLVKTGRTHLAQGKLDAAAKAFDEALELDGKLVNGGEPSTLRKQMQAELSEAALERGAPLLEHGEARAGCKLLKLGYRYQRANLELLTTVNKCTALSAEGLKTAKDCAALDQVIELAVDGDQLKEKAEIAKRAMGCP